MSSLGEDNLNEDGKPKAPGANDPKKLEFDEDLLEHVKQPDRLGEVPKAND